MMLSPVFKKLLPYALVVFLGYVGFSLPLPVLPELFLDSERSILGPAVSIRMKTFLLGVVLAAYPAGQLIGAPLLGWLSDRFGRKRVILISLLSTAMGYGWTALATDFKSVIGMFLALFVCGFSEGNTALAQAVIGDLAPKQEKAVHFGWINLFTCMAFIVGPLMGGWLADPHNSSFFTFATPFWAGAILSLLGALVIWKYAEETKVQRASIPFKESLPILWRNPLLKTYYKANFLIYFGIYSFFNCLAIYLQRNFDFSTTYLAYVMAYDSFFFAIGLLTLVSLLSKRFGAEKLTRVFAIIFGLLLIVLIVPNQPSGLIYTIPPIGMALAVLMTHAAVMVSNGAEDHLQGQALGVLQSVQVFAGMWVGVIGGILAGWIPQLPLIAGAAFAVLGGIYLRRKKYA
ncbi:MAG: MFS transporter [Rhabdochlamydiaceae bacterium]|jgi:MFS family permease